MTEIDPNICPECKKPYIEHNEEDGDVCYKKYVDKNKGMSTVHDSNPDWDKRELGEG